MNVDNTSKTSPSNSFCLLLNYLKENNYVYFRLIAIITLDIVNQNCILTLNILKMYLD